MYNKFIGYLLGLVGIFLIYLIVRISTKSNNFREAHMEFRAIYKQILNSVDILEIEKTLITDENERLITYLDKVLTRLDKNKTFINRKWYDVNKYFYEELLDKYNKVESFDTKDKEYKILIRNEFLSLKMTKYLDEDFDM